MPTGTRSVASGSAVFRPSFWPSGAALCSCPASGAVARGRAFRQGRWRPWTVPAPRSWPPPLALCQFTALAGSWRWPVRGDARFVAMPGSWRWPVCGVGRIVALAGLWRWPVCGVGRFVAMPAPWRWRVRASAAPSRVDSRQSWRLMVAMTPTTLQDRALGVRDRHRHAFAGGDLTDKWANNDRYAGLKVVVTRAWAADRAKGW